MRTVNFVLVLISLFLMPKPGMALQPRIVGGTESSVDARPYSAAILAKSLAIKVGTETYDAFYMSGSPIKSFDASLQNCSNAEFITSTPCTDSQGKVCLIERGTTYFYEKVQNCEAGGGVGAIIYNNVDGVYFGTLGNITADIPVVSTTNSTGLALLNQLSSNVQLSYINNNSNQSFCGASYIGGQWLVTAAHCVYDTDPSAIFVNVGGHDLVTNTDNVIDVDRILVYQNYDAIQDYNDIALIKLVRKPTGIVPIKIADELTLEDAISAGSTVVEMGRGYQQPVAPDGQPAAVPSPTVLYELNVQLITNDKCNTLYNKYLQSTSQGDSETDPVKPYMLCAEPITPNTGACFGDSGGAMVLPQNGEDYLIGATSWGIGCAVSGLEDVYTRVSYYKDDIEQVTSGASSVFGPNSTTQGNGNSKHGFLGAIGYWCMILFAVIAVMRFSCNKKRYA